MLNISITNYINTIILEMRTVVLGDTHGRSVWKLIVNMEKPDRVIFIGDYFDSFNIPAVDQMYNFNEIVEYKESGKADVIMLIGNHDHHYYPEIGNTGTSGYQYGAAAAISKVIDENREHLQMAYSFDNFLFTHAGVSPVFMDQVFGEDGWEKDNIVEFNGMESSGDNTTQTPIWIRPRSLMSANKKHEKGLKNDYIQIVGHTQMQELDLIGSDKFTGGKYYFVDTLDTSGQYLIIEDGKLMTNTWKNDKA
jgi:predicted MPP superfamily phosphohydrolase